MSSASGPHDPYKGYNYKVEIDSVDVGGFDRVSGLTVQMETVTYSEGGRNDHIHHLPGQFQHSNLVLRKGVTDRTALWDWIDSLKTGSMADTNARRTVVVKLQKNYKSSEMWGWEFTDAYPVRWTGPELRADQGAVALETVELVHNGLSKIDGLPP